MYAQMIDEEMLTGSRSGSENITPVPSPPKKSEKQKAAATTDFELNAANTVQLSVEKPAASPPLTSETIKKEVLSPSVVESSSPSVTNDASNTVTVTTVESTTSEVAATETEPDENVPELPQFLEVLLKKIADQEGFVDYTLNVSAGSSNGDGFLAIVKRVVISGSRNGKSDNLPLICKLMPTSKFRREQVNTNGAFICEAFMYDELLPTFNAFQKEKGLTEKDGFFNYPKSYGTMSDEENDRFVIVMEDIKATGYQLFDKLKPADFNHVKLFVESLGRFHAVSFALKDQRPEVFNKFKHLQDFFYRECQTKPTEMGQTFGFFFDKAMTAFKPEDEAEIKALNKLRETYMDELKRTTTGEANEQFSVVNHGDCWNNNMMYRYGAEVK